MKHNPCKKCGIFPLNPFTHSCEPHKVEAKGATFDSVWGKTPNHAAERVCKHLDIKEPTSVLVDGFLYTVNIERIYTATQTLPSV
jgi:hypothetical protein